MTTETARAESAMRRHRFALAVIVLLVGVFFAPALATRQVFTFRDHSDYFQPLRYYTSIHLKSLQLPWWNPYSQSGEPWLANPQTGVFYAPTWLFAFLPFETAYMLYLAFHLALLGCGAYLLFARQVRAGAALVGAVALTFCGPVMSLVDVSNNLASFAWVPLVIWCAVARARPQLAALVLAMTFLAGEPFFAGVAALLYAIATFVTEPAREAARKVAIAGAGAFGLSAIQLLPFVEMLRGSDRAAGLQREEIFAESMKIGDWLRIAVPPHFSLPGQPLDPALSQHFIPVIYVGMLVVTLAVVGLISSFRAQRGISGSLATRRAVDAGAPEIPRSARHELRKPAWLLLLIASIIVAAGNTIPLADQILTRLPVTLFRYPSRVVAFGALAIAALAAAGWDRMRPDRRWADLIVLLIVLLDVVPREKPLYKIAPFVTDRVPYASSIGRMAKMARITTGRLTNRSAWLAGYLNLYQRRFDASTAAPVANDAYMRLEAAAISGRPDLLNFMGIGYLFCDQPLAGMTAVARNGPVTVYENPGALPVATFWSSVQSHDTDRDVLEAMQRRPVTAVLHVAPRTEPGPAQPAPVVSAASLAIVDAHHAEVVIDAPADGVVMIAQQDDPGWRVKVDGVEGKKLKAGGVFRAVAVKKGRHEIVWTFHSRAFLAGLTMTLITSLSLLTSRFVKRSAAEKFSS